ncbi:Similar to hypothetical protein [Podospora anserina S mat+]; acc. no. XP_001903708 [Pyronema omphalodes CBS 100304]|uniref:Uncharacterized protein n=1 Tax=Pyronema omphalodes (strain CBS 100304) TaxID=1076935 RepID=U4LEJ1_PYROM|nr:Similar to hypothetical protein [Podospora anserina S mat+]; acc. no. XP_001903708 [Pyronema omphalodes CBS 100304]
MQLLPPLLLAAPSLVLSQTLTLCAYQGFSTFKVYDSPTPNGECYNLPGIPTGQFGPGNDWVQSYKVENGCCAFYKNAGCDYRFFYARNRGDSSLKIGEKNQISSFRCGKNCLAAW